MANIPLKPPQIQASRDADLLIFRIEGEYTLEATKYVQASAASVSAEYGYNLQLIDVRKAGAITPEARRWLFSNHDASKLLGSCAVFGASFAIRTLAQMVIRALHTIAKGPLAIRFFDDEGEARVWLDQERARLQIESIQSQ
jgi:hypothetical protein